MAYRRARPGQAQALPGLQARARLDPREFGQAGPGFTEAWPAWPVGNTGGGEDRAGSDGTESGAGKVKTYLATAMLTGVVSGARRADIICPTSLGVETRYSPLTRCCSKQ